MTEKTTAVAPQTPLAIIAAATADPNVDVEKLRALLELQQTWEAGEVAKQRLAAEVEFADALNAVQKELEPVIKDSHNKQTNSLYAKLDKVQKKLHPVYTKHGFSISHFEKESPIAGETRYVMRVRRGMHSEEVFMDLPPDDKGIKGMVNKTTVHGRVSSGSYAQRYLETRYFGIVLTNTDNDGNAQGEAITDKQKSNIIDWISATDTDTAKFCAAFKIDCVDSMPAKSYDSAVAMLKKKHELQGAQ